MRLNNYVHVECDEKVQHIMKELYASFVTPFEREDISDLALRLDDIVDGMNSVAERLDLFNVDDTRKEAMQLAELTLRACKTVQEMLSVLSDYKKDSTVMEKAIAVGHVEDEGDLIYHNALSRLFRDEMPGPTIPKTLSPGRRPRFLIICWWTKASSSPSIYLPVRIQP